MQNQGRYIARERGAFNAEPLEPLFPRSEQVHPQPVAELRVVVRFKDARTVGILASICLMSVREFEETYRG